jgi:hypothetical protein
MVAVAIALAAVGLCAAVVSIQGEALALDRGRRHLRHIGLALKAFQGGHGAFPSGTVANPALPPERRLSWLATLSSYWDIGGLYNAIRRDEPWDSQGNARLARVNFLTDYEPYPGDLLRRGLTPYVGIAGLGVDSAGLPEGHVRAGAFGYGRVTSDRDIRDGMGATMVVAETAQANGPWMAGGPATVRGLDPSRRPYVGRDGQFGGIGHRGALVLLADGSIRTIRETIDPKVFEALVTVAGGEAVPAGWDR